MPNETRRAYWSAVERSDYLEAERLITTYPNEFPDDALEMFGVFRRVMEAFKAFRAENRRLLAD